MGGPPIGGLPTGDEDLLTSFYNLASRVGPLVRQQFFRWDRGKSGVVKVKDPVAYGPPHGPSEYVHMVRAVVAHFRQFEAFGDVQHLEQAQTGSRGWSGGDAVPVVMPNERAFPLHGVTAKVVGGDVTATGSYVRRYLLGQLTLVKVLWARAGQAEEGLAVVFLDEKVAGVKQGVAVPGENGTGRRCRRSSGGGMKTGLERRTAEQRPRLGCNPVPVQGQRNRGANGRGPILRTELAQGGGETGDGAWGGYRPVADVIYVTPQPEAVAATLVLFFYQALPHIFSNQRARPGMERERSPGPASSGIGHHGAEAALSRSSTGRGPLVRRPSSRRRRRRCPLSPVPRRQCRPQLLAARQPFPSMVLCSSRPVLSSSEKGPASARTGAAGSAGN